MEAWRLTGNSAFSLLHFWYCRENPDDNHLAEFTKSTLALSSMTTMMIDTVREFLPHIHAGWTKSHHPQGIHPVFLAACQVRASGGADGGPDGLRELKEMLHVQSRRWTLAGRLFF